MKIIGKLAIAASLALLGLAPAQQAQAQPSGDVHVASHVFDCAGIIADQNGYFYLQYYGGSVSGWCIANAGKSTLNNSGWSYYQSGNNRGAIEVRTGSGLYYKQPFEKWTKRWLEQDDVVLSVEIY